MLRSNVLLSHPYVSDMQQQFLACTQKRTLVPLSYSITTQKSASDFAPTISPSLTQSQSERLPVASQDREYVIPSSVRGAPEHLRRAIRKRQNSESAKRSRLRRKEAAKKFHSHFDEQCRRISALEQRVRELAELVRREEAIEREELEDSEATSNDESQSVQGELSASGSGEGSGEEEEVDYDISAYEQEVSRIANEAEDNDVMSDLGLVGYGTDLTGLIDTCIDTADVGEILPMFAPSL